MAKKSTKRHIRKLTKVGGSSYAVTLPIHLVRELNWRERQKLTVTRKGNTLIIKDWPAWQS